MRTRFHWNLPDDILLEILSRLPPKSVGHCRCVSKPWRALLTRPEFITAHLHRSMTLHPESLILLDALQGSLYYASSSNAHHLFDKITLSANRLLPAIRWVVASCHGLILAEDHESEALVVNPITEEIRGVPPLTHSEYNSICWGFGYDSGTNDYKVVAVAFYSVPSDQFGMEFEPNPAEMFVSVFSLKTGSWKRVESSLYDHSYSKGGVFVCGRIHWLAIDRTSDKRTIVAFDLTQERFSEVSPPCLIEKSMHFRLDVIGDSLCLLIDVDHAEKCVWVMKEYGVHKSWTKFVIKNPKDCDGVRLICSLGHEEVALLKDYEWFVMYNVKQGSVTKDIEFHGVLNKFLVNVRNVDSLVSPYAW